MSDHFGTLCIKGLKQFSFEASFPNLKPCFRNQNFVTGIESFFSKSEVSILQKELQIWVAIKSWKWCFESEFFLTSRKQSCDSKIKQCVESVQIRSYLWSEYTEIRPRKNSVFGQFSRSGSFSFNPWNGASN